MTRTPTLYLSHGAPPLADDPLWTRQLADWSTDLPTPEAILIVSAHWEAQPLTIGATRTIPLVYDFWGFPQHYYDVTYPAPGAPRLAADIRKLLGGKAHDDPERGLDHGAYVPLVEMYPDADIPTLQISMPTLDPRELYELGRALAPLRDQGVLIIGSGFTTHNLREMDPAAAGDAPAWSKEFDEWTNHAVTTRDIDALIDFQHKAPAARIAHPRTEHYAPLFVALGASEDKPLSQKAVVDGYWYGLAKRSFQFD
ncbi:dioxygenase family protein [Phytomonospora endophytica]|uniref:4,5-DOPA dioxygenase extradiol n=1 Tax=Phytomonospora endophytica TaxID=714109 RepID=A0A841FE69_9ACTN|nr:class III extradiol ring-cleavage dioxygenase [Phytomonospora endophytica]MBB6033815.1 4,5-DOPA dioxygenase extradiol [Phytomonospora endophytica]GIG64667.1 dioxygenase [Phytomonospora endophytica]